MVYLTLVIYVFLLLVSKLVGTEVVLSDMQVLKNYAVVNFPETIDFVLELEAEATVENARLIYGTNATSCNQAGASQPLDFDPDKTVELEWQWDLKRSGALPPGAEIWWQWEIEDANGNTFSTDRQSITNRDDRHTWQTISSSDVTVNWYDGDSLFGKSMMALAVESLERLKQEAGLTTSNHVQLWIYRSAADVRDAVVNSADWTGGVAFPSYGITVIGISPGDDEWAAKVIPHELAHLVGDTIIFNCRGGRMPTWLSEGLAEFSSGGGSETDLTKLYDQLAEERLPPLHFLSHGFSAYSAGADQAYTQSAEVVRYLIEVFGAEKMAELLDHIKMGQPIDDALEATYGFDTAGLDAEWRTSQGYAPTPTSAADYALQMASPTQIPTLALAGIPVLDTPTPPPATVEIPTLPVRPTVTGVPLPATPAPTKTPVEVAAVSVTETIQPATVSPNKVPAESSGSSLILIFAGAGFLILIGIYLFKRYRGG